MKKWKCPKCENLTGYLIAAITGSCTIGIEGEAKIDEWESSYPTCEECGFTEDAWASSKFEVVEVVK